MEQAAEVIEGRGAEVDAPSRSPGTLTNQSVGYSAFEDSLTGPLNCHDC